MLGFKAAAAAVVVVKMNSLITIFLETETSA